MSVSTGDSLMRQCVLVLDAIYSHFNCVEFITPLQEIESNLFNNAYNTFDDFQKELLDISQITSEFLNSINLCVENKVPEEYCTTPIYSSIQYHEKSLMYSVNIKSHHQLHSSIYDALNNPSNLPLHRLYITKKGSSLIHVRDNIHDFITLFFDVETTQSEENPDITMIHAKVVTVHPIGELHSSTLDTFEGWMKVKIAHSKEIHSIIPTALAQRLFDKKEQIPRRISVKPTTDLVTARQNELTRQFLINITGSRVKEFESCYPTIHLNNLLTSSPNEYTQSSLNKQKSIPSEQSQSSSSSNLPDKTVNTLSTTEETSSLEIQEAISEPIKPEFKKHWRRLEKFAYEKNVDVVPMSKYDTYIKRNTDAEGYFKHVYFTSDKVIQIFRRSTASQRVVEIASLLSLKDTNHIGCIKELIYDETTEEIIGLTMERYNMTLKQYLKLHSRHRLSPKQRMHIIIQMLKSMRESHQLGIAHRDLSSVNFMIDTNNIDDNEPHLYLIDFGKAVFYFPSAAKKWWVHSDNIYLYEDEVNPDSKQELAIWCKNLPYVMARPDHGYRFYRSIQTLPRANKDRVLLPYLIDPAAEDIYSLGNIVWKIFLDIEPWPGVFDTDLKKLRETVGKDANIDNVLDQTMPGPYSKYFLQMFLRANPEDRKSAADIMSWLERPDIQNALIAEWSLEGGGSRKVSQKVVEPTVKLPVKTIAAKPKSKPLPVKEIKTVQAQKRKKSAAEEEETARSAAAKRRHIVKPLPVKETKTVQVQKRKKPAEEEEDGVDIDRPVVKRRQIGKGRKAKRESKKSEVQYVFKDGIKCYAKSGIPTGRPSRSAPSSQTTEDGSLGSKPSSSYVKTGKPRGRPKNPESSPPPHTTTTTGSLVAKDTSVVEDTTTTSSSSSSATATATVSTTAPTTSSSAATTSSIPVTDVAEEDEPVDSVQHPVPHIHSFKKSSSPRPPSKPLPPALCMSSSSRPPSLSPQYVHPVQLDGSQSAWLSMSPVSHVDPAEQSVASVGWSPEISSKKRKAAEISGDPGVSQVDGDDKLKKQCLAVTDEFDRALYNILQSLGLDSSV